MRYPIYAASTLLAVVFLSSCDTHTPQEEPFANPYDEIAKLHSEGLEAVRLDLARAAKTGSGDPREIAKKSARRFMIERFGESAEVDVDEGLTMAEEALARGVSADDLPKNVRPYVRQLLALLTSEVDEQTFEARSRQLEEKAHRQLGEETAAVVLFAGAVARDSRRYWKENRERWAQALRASYTPADAAAYSVQDGPGECDIDWNRAATADVMVGAFGFTGISIGYILRWIAWSALGGPITGVVAGALGSSALNAAMQWYDKCR